MENNSDSNSIKDNGLLTVKKSPRSGRDAATQTPQMIRQPTPTRRTQGRPLSRASSSSDESMDYLDTFSHPPSRNAEIILSTPVPDVIVEHSNDTFPLTQITFPSTPMEQHPSGITNLAFEDKDEIVRPNSFRQKTTGYHRADPILVQQKQQLLIPSNPMHPNNRRLYYSLPRSPTKKNQEKDLQVRSQPPTPQMNRTKTQTGDISDPPFWIIPREHSLNSLNTIPATTSNYAAPESVGGLYTISGRSTYVSNGFPEPVIGLYEMHLMPPGERPDPPKSPRKFEFTKMPASVEKRRRRLQLCTDSFSVLLFFPGLLIGVFTPALVTPLFYVAPKFFIPYILIFLASGTLSVVFFSISGILGNVVWIYDENSKKLKPRLHCGKGPTFHFWGNGFYNIKMSEKQNEITV